MRQSNKFFTLLSILLLFGPSGLPAAIQQDQALALYSNGIDLVMDGNFSEALVIFENMTELYPESRRIPDARFYIGYCLEKLNKPEEAFQNYKAITNSYDSNLMAFRKAAKRASFLARKLSKTKNDQYNVYLQALIDKNKDYSNTQLIAAIKLAENGDWSNKDLLISGLTNAPLPVQLKISELLVKKRSDSKVAQAFRQSIERRSHPVIRLNAVKALSGNMQSETDRKIMIDLVNSDSEDTLRTVAANALLPLIDNKQVKEALKSFVAEVPDHRSLHIISEKLLLTDEADQFSIVLKNRLVKENNPLVKMTISNLLNDDKGDKDVLFVWTTLANSPEPEVRVKALHELKTETQNPLVLKEFIRRAEEDKDVEVQVTAISGLKGKVDREEVQSVIIKVIEKSDDPAVVSSSVRVVANYSYVPEIRKSMIRQLKQTNHPVVVNNIANALTVHPGEAEVVSAIIEFLRSDKKFLDAKLALLNGLSSEFVSSLFDELSTIAKEATDPRLKKSIESRLNQ
jgi:hypothetical protein